MSKFSSQSKSVFSDDDRFWDEYNRLSAGYRKQLDPYLYYIYDPSVWDNFRARVGGRNNEMAVREAAAAKAWDMLGSLSNDEFQNTYNSQQAQASRERDAGLNPDLTGIQDADPAAGMEQPSALPQVDFLTPPPSLGQDMLSILKDAASLVAAAGNFDAAIAAAAVSRQQRGNVAQQTLLAGEQVAGSQISNASSAKDYVDKLLSGIDPDTWKSYQSKAEKGEDAGGVIKQKIQHLLDGLPASARQYVNMALNNSLQDPGIMKTYYQNLDDANVAAFNAAAGSKVYGNIADSTLSMLTEQNKMIMEWKVKAIRRQHELDQLFLATQLAREGNSLKLEELRKKHNIPQAIVDTEVAQYVADKFAAEVSKERTEVDQKWFKYLDHKTRSHDPEEAKKAKYLLNMYLVKTAAPLMQHNQGWGFDFGIGEQGLKAGFNRSTGDTTFDQMIP